MGASTKNGRFAVAFTALAFSFILIAFCTPHWLDNDGQLENARFINLGLWTVCLRNFTEIHRHYPDVVFNGCMWVFEEEYYIIHNFLLPDFYVATQFFFTLCFTLLLIALLLTLGFLGCSRDDTRYTVLLIANGTIQLMSAFFGLISVIIFGARGDGRDWMPNWEHNNMGWSFALACVGVLFLLPSGTLYIIEARRERYRKLNEIGTREASAYTEEGSRKYRGGQTDI
uniref:Putative conserved plasma membrane protein n=1 Tax=Tabanus bromius TaxID=304241 RepID=A0A0K8TRD6_TABBR